MPPGKHEIQPAAAASTSPAQAAHPNTYLRLKR